MRSENESWKDQRRKTSEWVNGGETEEGEEEGGGEEGRGGVHKKVTTATRLFRLTTAVPVVMDTSSSSVLWSFHWNTWPRGIRSCNYGSVREGAVALTSAFALGLGITDQVLFTFLFCAFSACHCNVTRFQPQRRWFDTKEEKRKRSHGFRVSYWGLKFIKKISRKSTFLKKYINNFLDLFSTNCVSLLF